MFDPSQYALLDFGNERKLERFGPCILDRPSPAAEGVSPSLDMKVWRAADARYTRGQAATGVWKPEWPASHCWTIEHPSLRLELKPTGFGHLGVFPEHAAAWDWIVKQVRRAARPLKVLNLFAYTGAATLAAAAAGAEVVHVDSASNIVKWARRNAEWSQLSDAPIRWIAEDAQRFVQRERKRGKRYDAVILDPPTYGHGPKGESWKVTRDLSNLLTACADLTQDEPAFVLLSCHSEGFGAPELQASMLDAFFGGRCQAGGRAGAMSLRTADGRSLNCGAFARWPAD